MVDKISRCLAFFFSQISLFNFIEFLAILGPPRDPEGHFEVGKLTEMVSGQHPGTILGNRTPLRSLTF